MFHELIKGVPRGRFAVAAAAIAGLAVSGTVLAAPGDPIVNLNVDVAPSALPEDKPKAAELQIDVSTCFEGATPGDCRSEDPRVPDTTRMVFGFDRQDIVFNPGEAKECKHRASFNRGGRSLASMDPSEAVKACGKGSVVGVGVAVFNQGNSGIPANVTVFNAKPKGGNPVILFHAYASGQNAGTVPVGVLKRGNKLDTKVDPLLSGGVSRPMATLQVDIKKGAYVQARCSNGEIKTTSKSRFRDALARRAEAMSSCTRRP